MVFSLLYENYAVSMISMDLTVAAFILLNFLIYNFRKKPIKIIRYLIPMFLVGFFSIASLSIRYSQN
ncbi:MAG: hypothetical protein CM15mP102_09450 [Flavobacteriales bacterium]|nr:MAG: hypothetical protein CM15mP102_09450 [Flavobacteriales bacterium]